MKSTDEKIVGGLCLKEDLDNKKISGGLGIKQITSHEKVGYTSIGEDSDNSIDINIPNRHIENENINNGNTNTYNVHDYYQPKRGRNKGLIIALSSVSIGVILGATLILSNNNNQVQDENPGVVNNENIPEEEDATYAGSETRYGNKPEKADTTLTSNEKKNIEQLLERFYIEHIQATNSGNSSYVMDYLTQNGDYRQEYYKLMENHSEMVFDLMDLNILSVIKQNNNTYMVTVKDKIKVDRPENISIQACKTVYEVRQIDGEFLIHAIKSETTLKNESKILETKEVIEEPIIEEPYVDEPVIEEPINEVPIIEE